MPGRRVGWRMGVLVLAAVQLAGCADTVQRFKQRGIEFESGKVKRVYRF